MRLFLPLFVGMLLLPSVADASSGGRLYDQIKQTVERETGLTALDLEVAEYIRAIVRAQLLSQGVTGDDLTRRVPTAEDITLVLRDTWTNVCGRLEGHEGVSSRPECQEFVTMVRRLAADEMRVRTMGRLLQAETTGYELPIADVPGRSAQMTQDLRGILAIWGAGGSAVSADGSGVWLRTVSLTPRIDDNLVLYQQRFTAVRDALLALSREQQIAAVWRYQYGVRLVRNDRAPRFPAPYDYPAPITGSGSERQYLFHRWTEDGSNVEGALLALWEDVQTALLDVRIFQPPLQAGETALITFPKDLQDILPGNVLLWARLDGEDPLHPLGDIGLQWIIPLEPVLPSLTKGDVPILGGTYPPEPVQSVQSGSVTVREPVDGRGLCSDPSAMRGYLCRSMDLSQTQQRCPRPADLPADAIGLVSCSEEDAAGIPQGEWCCMQAENRCRYAVSAVACTQAGGSPSGSPEGCIANGCPLPPVNPVWCCVPGAGAQCKRTINSNECSLQGGSPSVDALGCMANGCKMPTNDDRYTMAGSDVCRDIAYVDRLAVPPIDVQTECTLDIRCTPDCTMDLEADAATYPKRDDGIIPICMENSPTIVSTYLLYHEFVHAQYFCGKPPETRLYTEIPPAATPEQRSTLQNDNNALCCEHEGTAYRAMCDLMERDGVFKAAGGSIDGIPLNAETCTEVLTQLTCSKREGLQGCYLSRSYPDAFMKSLYAHLLDNPANVPATCAQLRATVNGQSTFVDPRIAGAIEEMEGEGGMCMPGNISRYPNRIGNNLCYIGQCVEESVQAHRMTPGRTPTVVQGVAAPWDDATTGTPLATLLTNPPLSQARFPFYRPESLVTSMETALCQQQGLPPRTPPVLCGLSVERQLGFERLVSPLAVFGMTQQSTEQEEATMDLLSLSPALGARIGTTLYARYLEEASRSFAVLLSTAADLLSEMKTIRFPTQMCPIAPGLPSS